MTVTVPFTQYLRPDGRQRAVTIEVPDHLSEKVKRILDAGLVFECEELSTGICSFTITSPEQDELIKLCPNGPKVPATVVALIEEYEG